jgi:hypothetical protein
LNGNESKDFKNLKKGENKLNFEGIIKFRQISVEKKSIDKKQIKNNSNQSK